MSVQVRRRRETAAFLASFVGAQGELLVDTTNNRVQVHDGVTPGGFAAAKLADVAQRTAVADAAYAALASDRTIAFTALTAARTVTLPAASAFPVATQLVVLDEAGACSATVTITLARAGGDTINGASAATIALPFGYLALTSDGRSRWTILDQSTAGMAQQNASAVAITGGRIDGTALGATTPAPARVTTFTATGATVVGGLDSASRYAAFDTFGRITWRYDDNGFVSGPILNNYALTAAGQGADALKVNLGAGGALVSTAGIMRFAATDTFQTVATASGKWQIYGVSAGSVGIGLEIGSNYARLPSLPTVANLPSPGALGAGAMIYCTNARMLTSGGTLEAAGAGSGGLVTSNGSVWRVAGTNITASA